MDNPSLTSAVRELSDGLKAVIRSEIRLAKIEFRQNSRKLLSHSILLAVFGGIALLGVFPLKAFLVIGLGRFLNDNYWLSSLVVAVFMIATGGLIARAALRRLKSVDLRFDETKESIVRQIHTVDRKLHEVSETAKRRVTG